MRPATGDELDKILHAGSKVMLGSWEVRFQVGTEEGKMDAKSASHS